ncbi:MAG: 7-cyano-7-deazaguanine synthase [Nanoarchaeota archaeon]|nr:7-cyano-7-deazaguanine synthase [Nanoarchaeota archaeon]MBU1945606.1 7-cyano-7-deazaguanine synthase [Nanoarchaeota archaeon]
MDVNKFIEEQIKQIKEKVGNDVAINALSGGVDSSVVALLAHKALGDKVKNIFLNTGMMRENEPETMKQRFAEVGVNVEIKDVSDRFFNALKGEEDGENKRKIFRDTFYKVLGEAVKSSGAKCLLQGTIKPDVEETKAGVKTQHNILSQIGIDPEKEYGFKTVEPLIDLVKWEVREVGKALGLPQSRFNTMPFLGPGLMGRVIGEVTIERVAIVRKANNIVEEELMPLKPFQCLAVLFKDMATMKSDENAKGRNYGNIIAVRCIESKDARTAEITEIPYPILKKIVQRITTEIPGVIKVVYDITPKPPSTIEYI